MKKISKIMLCSVGLLMAAENVWASGEPAASAAARRVAPNEVLIHFDVPAGKELAWQRGKGKLFVKFYAEAKGLKKAGYAPYIERPVDKEDMVFAISDVGMYRASWEFNRQSVLLTEFTYNGTSIVDGDNLPLGVINVPYNGEGVPVIAYTPVRHVDATASSAPMPVPTAAQEKKLAFDQTRKRGDMAPKTGGSGAGTEDAESERSKEEIARLAELRQAELLRQAAENTRQKKAEEDAAIAEQDRKDAAAIKIQSRVRQKAAVKVLQGKKAAASEADRKAEKAVRAAAVAEQARKDAAITIQSVVRGTQVRKKIAAVARLKAEEDAARARAIAAEDARRKKAEEDAARARAIAAEEEKQEAARVAAVEAQTKAKREEDAARAHAAAEDARRKKAEEDAARARAIAAEEEKQEAARVAAVEAQRKAKREADALREKNGHAFFAKTLADIHGFKQIAINAQDSADLAIEDLTKAASFIKSITASSPDVFAANAAALAVVKKKADACHFFANQAKEAVSAIEKKKKLLSEAFASITDHAATVKLAAAAAAVASDAASDASETAAAAAAAAVHASETAARAAAVHASQAAAEATRAAAEQARKDAAVTAARAAEEAREKAERERLSSAKNLNAISHLSQIVLNIHQLMGTAINAHNSVKKAFDDLLKAASSIKNKADHRSYDNIAENITALAVVKEKREACHLFANQAKEAALQSQDQKAKLSNFFTDITNHDVILKAVAETTAATAAANKAAADAAVTADRADGIFGRVSKDGRYY